MSKLPTFITIPRPVNGQYGRFRSFDERGKFDARAYFSNDEEKSLVFAAAKLCNCSVSEFLRQLALNTATAMGVQSDDRND